MQRLLDEKNYARATDVQDLPSLIEIQRESFDRFYREGLNELFDEISPIESFNGNLTTLFPWQQPRSPAVRPDLLVRGTEVFRGAVPGARHHLCRAALRQGGAGQPRCR
ncbi:MAG: hypothetical protein KatS3mg051_0308 [Anaerolineae bacterium]|nr:MAG: hypothetical protein KatS3mg051_0308 [Anaerolineae bacterium]